MNTTISIFDAPIHRYANLFPMMEDGAINQLADDIKANGMRVPITMFGGEILDGRNRVEACRRNEMNPTGDDVVEFDGTDDDALNFVVSQNLCRRHLDESQRAMVAARLADLKVGQRADRAAQICVPAMSQGAAAAMLNVAPRSVQHARKVIQQGAPELAQAVDTGDVAVSVAAEVAKLPKSEQATIVSSGPKGVRAAVQTMRKAKTTQAVVKQYTAAELLDRISADIRSLRHSAPTPSEKFKAAMIARDFLLPLLPDLPDDSRADLLAKLGVPARDAVEQEVV